MCRCDFIDADGQLTDEDDAVLILADYDCPTHYIDPTEEP